MVLSMDVVRSVITSADDKQSQKQTCDSHVETELVPSPRISHADLLTWNFPDEFSCDELSVRRNGDHGDPPSTKDTVLLVVVSII